MSKETIESIRKKAYKELIDYMEWMAKNYPEAHKHYLLVMIKRLKKAEGGKDGKTKEK